MKKSKPDDLDFMRAKKYFIKNIAPYFEEQERIEREFMERMEREGPFINIKPSLKSIDGGKK